MVSLDLKKIRRSLSVRRMKRANGDQDRTLSEEEYESLVQKIDELETERDEAAKSVSTMRKICDEKSTQIEETNVRLSDDNETSYAEMKNMLILENLETEKLQARVKLLQKKRKRRLRFLCVAFSFVAILVVTACFCFTPEQDRLDPFNVLCAPATPGTLMDASSNALEAPWWAPPSWKQTAFGTFCGNRSQIRLNVENNKLHISYLETTRRTGKSVSKVVKEPGDIVDVQTDRLVLLTKQGGRHEIEAPWSASEKLDVNGPRLMQKIENLWKRAQSVRSREPKSKKFPTEKFVF